MIFGLKRKPTKVYVVTEHTATTVILLKVFSDIRKASAFCKERSGRRFTEMEVER